MSKEELLKYLIAEIDLIMHDKDYRFENANGTWYSRESCRDLTNEEVLEELRTELRQFSDLEAKLAEKDKEIEKYRNANIIVVGERSQGKKHLMQIKIKELQNKKAIEQLEKVKENAWQSATDISCLLDYTELAKIIDNQIEELKKEMK